jgi:F0F1-type ATP synthase assembly protein I
MKLLPKITTPPNARPNTSEPLGHGFDAAFVVVLFFGLGFLLDRVLGTTPVFMIALSIFGAVGVFVRFWYRYDARMTEHETVRNEKAAAQSARRKSTDGNHQVGRGAV